MNNNFRTGNIDTKDLFSDDLTIEPDVEHEPDAEQTDLSDQADNCGQADGQQEFSQTSEETTVESIEELVEGLAKDPQEIIDELDSLRFVLNEGAEYQHDIPLLEDIEAIPEEITETISITSPSDIDVPILTDACDAEPAPPLDSHISLTDIAHSNMDQLLDQLIAEYLPILETRLRAELDKKIRTVITSSRTAQAQSDNIAEDNDTSID